MIDRNAEILKILETKHTVSFAELAKLLYISEPTARRDIANLEKAGLVSRIYKGATLSKYRNEVIPINMRDNKNSKAKEEIAERAAKLIKDGDTLFFDSSSTVRRISHYLNTKKDLTVITNNLRAIDDLKNTDCQIICTGGMLYKKRDCFLGEFSERMIENLFADIMFFSSLGISKNGEITDVDEQEISIRLKMMKHSKRKVYLCDSSKYNIVKALKICSIDDVDDIICEKELKFTAL